MATFSGSICVKFSEKAGRTRLDEVNLSGLVSALKERVSTAIGLSSSEFSLVYCGRLLRDTSTLSSYGLETGCTVHVLRKKKSLQSTQAEPLDDVAIRQLMTALRAALLNPAHRQAVHKILTSAETIDNIIAATPGLANDHVAVSMLRDPELLIQIADAENVRRIVRAHPAIGHAVMHVAASVSEEGAASNRGRGADELEQGSFPPDLSDDEMDTSPEVGGGGTPQLITQAQLSAALAAAGVGGSAGSSAGAFNQPYASSPTPRPTNTTPQQRVSGTPAAQRVVRSASGSAPGSAPGSASGSASVSRVGGQPSSSGAITADLFSQAMAQALQQQRLQQPQQAQPQRAASGSQGVTDRPDGAALSADQLQAQLLQLRSMGITDEAACLRALQATGGNVQAALDLIFEGRL